VLIQNQDEYFYNIVIVRADVQFDDNRNYIIRLYDYSDSLYIRNAYDFHS